MYKTADVQITSDPNEDSAWRSWIFIVLVFITTVISPWFTALFFAPASTVFATVITLICLVVIRYRKLPQDPNSPVLWSLVLAAYMALTNLWAASAVGSVQITVLQISALFFFVAVSQWGRRLGTLFIVVLSAIGIALYVFGMGAEVGWWKAVNAVYGKHLLASVFEYHNTFGAVELAITVFAFVARPQIKPGSFEQVGFKRGWLAWATQALVWLAIVIGLDAVLGSYSRVVWALTPFALIAALWIRAKLEQSFWPVVSGAISLIVAVGSGIYAIKVLETGTVKDFLVSILIALVGIAFVIVFEARVSGRSVHRRKVGLVSGVVTLLILAALYILRHHLAQSAGSIAARLHSISLGSISLQERLYYYRNALGIWGNSPVFGSGGGTWTAKYQAFQTLPYISNEAHSSIIDQLLNGGVIGLALELTVFALVIVVVVKGARRTVDVAQRALLIAGFLAAVVMFAHSVVDFDFAFGFYQYMFWGLLGLSVSIAVHALRQEVWQPASDHNTVIEAVQSGQEVAAGTGEVAMASTLIMDAESSIGEDDAVRAGVVSSATTVKGSGAEWKKAREETARRETAEKRAVSLSRVVMAGTGLVGVVTLVLAGTLSASQLLTQAVAQPGQTIDAQLSLTQTALTLAPYNPAPYLAIAQYDVQTAQSAQDPALFGKAWNNITVAAALGPWDSAVQLQAALLAYSLGHTAAAVSFAQTAHHDAHFSATAFRTLLGLAMWYGAEELKTNPSAGKAELKRVSLLYDRFVSESKVINLKLFPAAIPLQSDASVQVYLGASDYLLGHYHQSLAAMNPFLKSGRDQAAVNLYEIVTVLDDAKLHITTKASVFYKRQILATASVVPEYQYLLKI